MTPQPRVIVLQHVGCETLGSIELALGRSGLAFDYVRTFEGAEVPSTLGDACGLIIMGGPMSVYEENAYPPKKLYYVRSRPSSDQQEEAERQITLAADIHPARFQNR